MKTFKDLHIGDDLYVIDGDFGIRSIRIDGIRNIELSNTKIEMFRIGRKESITANANDAKVISPSKDWKGNPVEITYFSCFEAANEEKNKLRDSYIDKQFGIAKQAFNRIKKVAVNDDRLKKRIFDFFNINDRKPDEVDM